MSLHEVPGCTQKMQVSRALPAKSDGMSLQSNASTESEHTDGCDSDHCSIDSVTAFIKYVPFQFFAPQNKVRHLTAGRAGAGQDGAEDGGAGQGRGRAGWGGEG